MRHSTPALFRVVALVFLTLFATLPAAAQRGSVAPEAATSWTGSRAAATADRFMVAAANPLAVSAGLEMLADGGSAVDAAIAVQLVLGLVEPQSSGLGGGAFLLHWHNGRKELSAWDGREVAPLAARPDRFIADGRPMPFAKAVASGLSIGVPGVVRLLEDAHRAYGRLPWPRLFAPAIRLATDGFEVSARLNVLLRLEGPQSFAPVARQYFFDATGTPRPIGATLRNPAYADTLRKIAAEGSAGFYGGAIAAAIVSAVTTDPRGSGDLTADDLASYRVVRRDPLCATYRGRRVCGMPPPSSGGLAVLQTLALLEPFDLGRGASATMRPPALHLVAEAQKLAYADRDRYVADPAFVPLVDGLLDAAYVADRRKLISATAPMARPAAGIPRRQANLAGEDATLESVGTSHISIVDADGNAVSMTTTIEGAFGSRAMAAGFLLNNQLTDFSFRPADAQGRPVANRVEPGKRPRSTMAPTIVFDAAGNVEAVLGSPGGGRIILYVVKALVGMIDWELDPQAAAALPNFGSRGGAFEIELDPAFSLETLLRPWLSRPSLWYALAMRAMGHEITPDFLTSGLHIIQRKDGRWLGGADPRREGVAAGESGTR